MTAGPNGRALRRLFACVALCGWARIVHALESPVHADAVLHSQSEAASAQMQRDRDQREAEARARDLIAPDVRGEISHAGADEAAALPVEAPCFVLERFELAVPQTLPAEAHRAGASARPTDPFAFALAWLDPYRGQCIGERGAQHIVDGLGAQVLARGYVTTRLHIPQQDLSSRVLRIDLIPGLIHAIRFDGALDRTSWRTAFPSGPGHILRLQDLEQALVQFKQVPGQDAYFRVEPANEPGQSDIVVTLERERPWRLSGSVDNGGVTQTGKLQGTLSLSVDNPLGLNDRFNAALSHDLMLGQRGRGTRGWSAYYAIPYGFWSSSLTASESAYSRRVAPQGSRHAASGTSKVFEWQWARHLLRTHSATLGVQFRLGRRFARHFLRDVDVKVQRVNTTHVQWGLIERHYFGDVQVDSLLAWRQGVRWFGSHEGPAHDGPTYHYRMALLDTNVSVPANWGRWRLTYTSAFHGQWTPDRLYKIDQLAIGSRWTVRGFDGEQVLSAERGFYWRNDLAMALPGSGNTFYVGVDYGRVFGPGTEWGSGTQLMGAVIGWRGIIGRRASASRSAAASAPTQALTLADTGLPGVLSYDIQAGVPVWTPQGFSTAPIAVGFQLAYQY